MQVLVLYFFFNIFMISSLILAENYHRDHSQGANNSNSFAESMSLFGTTVITDFLSIWKHFLNFSANTLVASMLFFLGIDRTLYHTCDSIRIAWESHANEPTKNYYRIQAIFSHISMKSKKSKFNV